MPSYLKHPATPTRELKKDVGGETTTDVARKAAKAKFGATGMADLDADLTKRLAAADVKAKRSTTVKKTPFTKHFSDKPGWDK